MSYYRYWGKARSEHDGAQCHLLPYHCLDVAAVGWYLLAPERALTQQLASRLEMSPASLRELLVFLLGLHDLGKFARAFQALAQPEGGDLAPPLPRLVYTRSGRHDRLGALVWERSWLKWLRDGSLSWPGNTLDGNCREQVKQTLIALMTPMFGHHGEPVSGRSLMLDDFFGEDDGGDDVEAARLFVSDWARLSGVSWPIDALACAEWRRKLQTLSWTIAGWAVLSDWLGSDQVHFAYCQQRMPLADYWHRFAKPRAERVLAATGFAHPAVAVPYRGIETWFGGCKVTPTPLQHAVEEIKLMPGPQLFILEDITGAGKTEAACILTQRLLAAGYGDGLYFALPTMATSNAMYARLGRLHHRFYSEASRPSFVLAHGARELNDEFAQALANAQPDDRDYQSQEPTASAQCNRWLADSRKTALLAEVGVGTIDQALNGLLPLRHQSLRLYGLARKVLIVDEVHAYDVYMQTLLAQLLTHHARQGGSAILLTATLPARMRQSLTDAWGVGLERQGEALSCEAFPLLTQVHQHGVLALPVDSSAALSRQVAVEWLTQEEQAINIVLAAAEAGECVAWVRNTVDDAIRAFETIRQRHPQPARCLLFHSRFAMVDRQHLESQVLSRLGKESTVEQRRGQILISTQVFQESLDCDVDLMISDLAPIDLLIQRAGRLQRHRRGARRAPTLMVLAPEWSDTPGEDWLKDALPGTQAVYQDTSLCWLTQRVLREQGVIRMPEAARVLIEGVYGEVSEQVPDGLLDRRWEQLGSQRVATSIATFNALVLEHGYLDDRHSWSDNQEIGTRLSDEPSINVVLLKVDEHGELRLWAEVQRHAAMLSQLRLRQSQARKLAELPSIYQAHWQTLQQRYKALRYTVPWLISQDINCSYDPKWGVRFNQSGPS